MQKSPANNKTVLRKETNLNKLNFYKRSIVLYQMTISFCQRFYQRGDRTIDQMVQAARSAKQNIVEGFSDGVTSAESEIKLLGVARGSNRELLEDYLDFLAKHGLQEWKENNSRFEALHQFCKEHNELSDFEPFFGKWNHEEMANCAICLAHMNDKALTTLLKRKDAEFVREGGTKERMYAARMNYKQEQKELIQKLLIENQNLKSEISKLKEFLSRKQ